jgi:lysozyme
MLFTKLSITKQRILILAGISVLSIMAFGILFYNGILQIQPDRQRFPIQGIDISEHQGSIDWSKIDLGYSGNIANAARLRELIL